MPPLGRAGSRHIERFRAGSPEGMTALPEIPLLDVGVDWPFEVLQGQLDRVNALLDESAGRIPELAIKVADAISRRWLERWHPLYQEEIARAGSVAHNDRVMLRDRKLADSSLEEDGFELAVPPRRERLWAAHSRQALPFSDLNL
jgi:hypothetical protein